MPTSSSITVDPPGLTRLWAGNQANDRKHRPGTHPAERRRDVAGKPGRSGGSNKLPLEQHIRRGTYRRDRHGPRALATVVTMPAAPEAWTPTETGVGAAGRALLARFMERYELSLTEGEILLEAARAVDVLAALRAQALADIAAQRLELAWARHLVSVLGQLRMDRP